MSSARREPRHAKSFRRSVCAALCEDVPLYVVSALLLIAMGWAVIYHLRYANVDESVVPGRVRIYEQGETGRECLLFLDIADDMSATIRYHNWTLRGVLVLIGAEEDTILYQLTGTEVIDYLPEEDEAEDAAEAESEFGPPALLIRMPRTGLQGDFTGPWMTYLSRDDETSLSEWLFVEENGVARVGHSKSSNALTVMRKDLLERTQPAVWEYTFSGIVLSSDE